jgi:LEA14-like dessication related protein
LTRFINTVLITVFAFFVFLGIFWQFAGGGTGAGARGDPTVVDIEPRWQPASPQELLVDLTVHNPAGQEGRVSSITYEAKVDGVVVDKAIARVPTGPAVIVDPKADGSVQFPVDLPEGFIVQWWPDYMKDAEDTELSIAGTVALRRDDGTHAAPFEWRSSWTGKLADRLTEAVQNCDDQPTELCMKESRFFWKDGTLHATLTFHNPGPETVAIRNSTIRLLFADRAVVTGNVDLERELEPDSDTDVELAMSFSQQAITDWWPDHIARCERTPLLLGMDLQAHTLPDGPEDAGNVTTLQWTFPASPFQTAFVCDQ